MARRRRSLQDTDRQIALDTENPEDAAIIQEAKDRFKLAQDWESEFRHLYPEDVKFANGDSDNGWQWPTELKEVREANKRPCLTVNKVATVIYDTVNEGRKSKRGIKIIPVGEEISFKAAQVWKGIFKHIEYISKAQTIYDEAHQSQMEGGIGYWRVITDWTDDRSFDQDIYIAPVQDTMSVLLDPLIKQKDGSDAKFGFLFEDMERKEFERRFENIELPDASTIGIDDTDTWVTSDYVRIAEYYRLKMIDDELIFLEIGGKRGTFLRSEMPPEFKDAFEAAKNDKSAILKTRKTKRFQLEWYKIAGIKVIERRLDLKGKYIPIIRVPGRERRIEGKLERKGITRALKDAQRMYNYNTSANVEFGALQTKTPWVGPAEAFEGAEAAWNNANTQNVAYLTYRHRDEDGQEIPAPQRPNPPAASPAHMEGLKIAAAEIEMASGVYAPQQQQPTLERTPAAIQERNRIGQTATYDFVDALGNAIAYTGQVILDMAPHYFDTKRVVQMMADDGTISDVTLDPDAPDLYEEAKDEEGVIKIVLNPRKGKYLVQADLGPAFATQRQEAWNAMSQTVGGIPEMFNVIGDLMFKSADFPLADEIAERIKRQIRKTTPWLLDENAEGPETIALKNQIQQLSTDLAEAMQKLAESKLSLKGKDEMRDIDVYRAQTDRIGTLDDTVSDFKELGLDQDTLKLLVRKTIAEMMGFDLGDVIMANKPSLDAQETKGGSNGTGQE